jgi:hypothetical protein
MTSTTVRLDAFGLVTDGAEMSSIASTVVSSWSSLSSSLASCGGMAGDDELAEDWSPDYDDAAKGSANTAKAIATYLRIFDSLLAGTGAGYKQAELAGAGQTGDGGITVPEPAAVDVTTPPSALGSNPIPGGLGELAELVEGALYAVGVVFPRADVDKLSSASAAWSTYASDLTNAKNRLGSTLTAVGASELPQSGEVLAVRTAIADMFTEAADGAEWASTSLADLRTNVDETWAAIRDMLQSLAIELAIDVGISVALSFVTFGLGAIAGAAKATTTIARWVVKIADLIKTLKLINRVPADKFLKAANTLRKFEHGPLHWRMGFEVVKGTISGGASALIVSGLNGEPMSGQDVLAVLAGSAVGGFAGGAAGAATTLGRSAGRHAVQPTFFRATTTEAAKGAVEGAAGGVAGAATESAISGKDINLVQAGLFGMAAGGGMGAGGHAASTLASRHGGLGLDFDAGAALDGREGTNVDPQYLAGDGGDSPTSTAGSDASIGGDTGAAAAPGSDSTPAPAPAGSSSGASTAGGHAQPIPNDGPVPTPAGAAAPSPATAGGAGHVSMDAPVVDTSGSLDTSGPVDTSAPVDTSGPVETAVSPGDASGATDGPTRDSSNGSVDAETNPTANPVADSDSGSAAAADRVGDSTASTERASDVLVDHTAEAATSPTSTDGGSGTPVRDTVLTSGTEASAPADAVSADSASATAASTDAGSVSTSVSDVAGSAGDSPVDIPSSTDGGIPTAADLAGVQADIRADVAAHVSAAGPEASSPDAGVRDASVQNASDSSADAPVTDVSAADATPPADAGASDVTTPPADAGASDVTTTSDVDAVSPVSTTDASTPDRALDIDSPEAAATMATSGALVGAVARPGLRLAGADGTTATLTRPASTGDGGVPRDPGAPDAGRVSTGADRVGDRNDATDRAPRDADDGDRSATTRDEPPAGGDDVDGFGPERFTEESVAQQAQEYHEALDASLTSHGLDQDSFRALASKNILELSRAEMRTLLDIRDNIAPVREGDVLQKVLSPSDVLGILDGDYERLVGAAYDTPDLTFSTAGRGDPTVNKYGEPTQMRGFVARLAHVVGLSAPELRSHLGLNYSGSPFRLDVEQPMFAVRMHAGESGAANVHDEAQALRLLEGYSNRGEGWDRQTREERLAAVSEFVDADGLAATDPSALSSLQQALLPAPQGAAAASDVAGSVTDPYRGSAWAGVDGHATPENSFRGDDRGAVVPDLENGAELWEYPADGGPQRRVAVFLSGHWVVLL